MQKVATTTIVAKTIFHECDTFFCFVFAVGRIIFPQFMVAVGKFTFAAIRTVAKFSVFFAELKFFFVVGRFF